MSRYAEILASRAIGPFQSEAARLTAGRHIASHWHYYRAKGIGATKALAYALLIPAAYQRGREYYGAIGGAGAIHKQGGEQCRYVDSVDAIGLRFVGWSHDLIRMNHRGYYTDEYCHDILQGGVWQLPGRKGKARLVYGVCEMESRRADNVEMNPGSASLALTILESDYQGGEYPAGRLDSDDDSVRDAARFADGMAESEAESRREYNEAYAIGREMAELTQESNDTRAALLPLLAEFKQARRGYTMLAPSLCETIQSRISEMISDIEAARKKRAALWDNIGSWATPPAYAGFIDTAGVDVWNRLARASGWRVSESLSN